MYMNRKRAGQVGRETAAILDTGHYKVGEHTISVTDEIARAVEDTVSYPPDQRVPRPIQRERAQRIEVHNESTLQAARRLQGQGYRVAALNFASAKNPGGGFLKGARAQEESLARSSGLYACLKDHPMYTYHRERRDALYSDYAIYSPDVPVFRDDEGQLLGAPYPCAFITAPAVNAGVVLKRSPGRRAEVRRAMKSRIQRVLRIAAHHDHDALVLGAWGCGVFRNDTTQIAQLFELALTHEARNQFDIVVFAVLDSSKNRHFIGPFEDHFGRAYA